jgi:response regulator NasT
MKICTIGLKLQSNRRRARRRGTKKELARVHDLLEDQKIQAQSEHPEYTMSRIAAHHFTSSPRLLLVLDESVCSQALCNFVRGAGYQVCVSHSALAMIEVCRLSSPDVLIADLELPGMEGTAGLEEVCRREPLPIIVLAASPDEAHVKAAEQAQVLVYLLKPVRPADLEAAIPFAQQHFQRLRGLIQQAADLHQALDDRKSIEQAQGLATRRLGGDPLDALRRMRRLARNQNRKLRDIADLVLEAEETFGALEELRIRVQDSGAAGPFGDGLAVAEPFGRGNARLAERPAAKEMRDRRGREPVAAHRK